MFDDDRLPDPSHEELCAAVSKVFWRALRGLTPQASLAYTHNISDAIRSSLAFAIANDMRLCNSRFSSQERLPNEIWCSIWKKLSFLDLVAVSHVCNRWRLASRSCLTLWANPTLYTARSKHRDGWGCIECSGVHDEPSCWEDSPYARDSSNLPFIDDIFALSGNLPLAVRIDVVPYCPDAEALAWLGTALVPHAHRITVLDLRTFDPPTMISLTANLDVLPVLRSFSAKAYDEPLGWSEDPISQQLQLPVVEHINIGGDFNWPSVLNVHLPVVKTLGFTPRDRETLLGTLEACAALEQLSICLSFIPVLDLLPELGERIRAHVTTVKSVYLHSVTAESEQWVINTFYRPELRYFYIRNYHSPDDAFALRHSIFRDLRDAARLTVASRRNWDWGSLEIMDNHGRTRGLSLRSEHLAGTLSHVLDASCLRPDTLRELIVALACWDNFSSGCPPIPGVTSLSITIQAHPDPVAVFERAVASAHASPLPNLKDLQIVFTAARGTVSVPSADLTRLVRRVAPSLPLQSLALRGRMAVPDRDALPDGLAQDFRILDIVAYERQDDLRAYAFP